MFCVNEQAKYISGGERDCTVCSASKQLTLQHYDIVVVIKHTNLRNLVASVVSHLKTVIIIGLITLAID